jgi:2-polyprenyl-3-methyl-5-hydroxy-6-metoxy-1,4-benzoquinol methylase
MSVLCRVCQSHETAPLMNFGPQPNSMHLLARPDEPFLTHPLILWTCATCGFVFIAAPMPPDAFYTNVQHPTLTSPPSHLDGLLHEFAAAMPATAHILDIGANTGYLLTRFRDAGFADLHGIEPSTTRLQAQKIGLDVVGGYFTKAWAREYITTHGFPSLVICRHVLEHVNDLQDFLSGLGDLLTQGATLLLETPDLQSTADRGDCSVIWEQHVNYFDLPVLRRLLRQYDLDITRARRIGFGGGALLCYAAHREHSQGNSATQPNEQPPVSHASLVNNISRRIVDIHDLIALLRAQGKRIAGFGAGERGAMVVNLAAIGGMLDYVVDDNPQKIGRLLSGSRLPIRPSAYLRQAPPDYCILFPMNGKAVEKAIMKRCSDLAQRGMAFIELFPESGETVTVHETADVG